MNYLDVIIQGYCIDNNRKYLHDYFSREFQKAISKGYSAKEFHDGCLLVLNEWEAPMYKSLIERQNMLSLMIDRANNGEADLSELDKKPISKKGYIKQLETELNTITVQNYPAQLSTITKHKATGVIYYDGIQYIKDALKKAYKRTLFIYDDFGELFRYAVRYELISGIEVTQVGTESYLLKLNTYKFEFNRWLQEIKGWDYGNEKQYNEYLNKETFKEFLNYQQEQEQQRQNEIEAEKQSRAIEPPQQTGNYPAKFYALYHWLKIEMGIEKQFLKNDLGKFSRTNIEEYATNKYPGCSSQGFYRSFKDLDITNRTAIANSFGNGYKEKLIALSNNDNKLITHLKNYPN